MYDYWGAERVKGDDGTIRNIIMVIQVNHCRFKMSNQNCCTLLSMRTTLSIQFKTEKSCNWSVNHHFTRVASTYSGLLCMMSCDQLSYVMKS